METSYSEDSATASPRRLHPDAILLPGFILGVVMIVIGVVWVGILRERNVFDEWYPGVNIALEIGVGIAAGLTGIALVWMLSDIIPAMQRLREKLVHMIQFEDLRLWHALTFGLLAGIPEEILFRGAIQPVTGIIFAAVIFGVLHAITPTYMIYAVAAGFVLGIIAAWRGDLWAATAAHFTYDAGLFILMAWRVRRSAAANI
jgi:hypothetical protein